MLEGVTLLLVLNHMLCTTPNYSSVHSQALEAEAGPTASVVTYVNNQFDAVEAHWYVAYIKSVRFSSNGTLHKDNASRHFSCGGLCQLKLNFILN